MDDADRDLAEATAELSETLEDLRSELTGPPEGPGGLPRPPSPAEFLRFTERYAIPATIATLEAAIRALELFAAVLRAVEGRPIEAVGRDRSPAGDRLAATGQDALRMLDAALSELQAAAEGAPENPEARRLLEEARELRAEVDDRLSAALDEGGSTADTDPDDPAAPGGDGSEDRGVGIDVDEELASIKADVDDGEGETNGTDGDGTDAA